jgi:hypothetical protein
MIDRTSQSSDRGADTHHRSSRDRPEPRGVPRNTIALRRGTRPRAGGRPPAVDYVTTWPAGMRAVQITRFGGPEVLDVVDIPEPEAGAG